MDDFKVELWKDHLTEHLKGVVEHLENKGYFFVWRDATETVIHPPRLVHPGSRPGEAVACEVWHEDCCLLRFSRFAFDDGVGALINQMVVDVQNTVQPS